MKIRSDFVSNSSSSSFVVCGKIFDAEDAIEKIKNSVDEQKFLAEVANKYGEDYSSIDEYLDEEGNYDLLDYVLDEHSLQHQQDGEGDGDGLLIGLNPDEMKDEDTFLEFKKKITSKLNAIGLNVDVSDISFVSGGEDSAGFTFFESNG